MAEFLFGWSLFLFPIFIIVIAIITPIIKYKIKKRRDIEVYKQAMREYDEERFR